MKRSGTGTEFVESGAGSTHSGPHEDDRRDGRTPAGSRTRAACRATDRAFWGGAALAAFATVGLGSGLAHGATIEVPADHATIQAALNAAMPGDIVEVSTGVYNEKLVVPGSGTMGSPIVLRAKAGHEPILDGTAVPGNNMILLESRSHVHIEGLVIRNNLGLTNVDDGSGIRITGSAAGIELRGNRIHDMRGRHAMGITVYGTEATPIEGLVIDGNEIHDCEPASSEALALNGNVTGFEVTNNIVRDVNNIGIVCIGGESDIQPNPALGCRNGLIRGNTVLRANSNYGGGYAGGIYIDGGKFVTIENNVVGYGDIGIAIGAENAGQVAEGNLVRNNVVFLNEKAGIYVGGFSSSVGTADNNQIRGNTLYGNNTVGAKGQGTYFKGGGFGELWPEYGFGNVFENNLVHAGAHNVFVAGYASGATTNASFDYNLYYSAAGASSGFFVLNGVSRTGLGAWKAGAGQDPYSIDADPLLVDPDGLDFHLADGSPAIDAGDPGYVAAVGETDLDGAPRVRGLAIDIGADETTCGDGVTDPGEQCDDGNGTSGDGCDANCTPTGCGNGIVTAGEDCDDGNLDAGDCCDTSCAFEAMGASCEDDSVCTTIDACDGAGTCVGSATPAPVCRLPVQAGASKIKVRSAGAKSSIVWGWTKGAAVEAAEFGDPLASSAYTFCLYEEGASARVVAELRAPAGGGWKATGQGYRYKDRALEPDGVQLVQLGAGAAGSSKAKLKARGTNMDLGALGFGAADAVVAQLRGDGGLCLGARYATPFARDEAEQFQARSE